MPFLVDFTNVHYSLMKKFHQQWDEVGGELFELCMSKKKEEFVEDIITKL